MRLWHKKENAEAALVWWEVLVVVFVVAVIAVLGFVGLKKGKQHSRDSACMTNLKQIGTASGMYNMNSSGRLPYAYVRYNNQDNRSWDAFLGGNLRSLWLAEKGGEAASTNRLYEPLLLCPQDTVAPAEWAQKFRGQRRSYAMPRHDMRAENWPPSAGNNTGVGLWLDFGGKGEKKQDPKIYNYEKTNQQAAVTMSMIQNPSATLFATEQLSPNNILGISSGAFITKTADHLGTNSIPAAQHHQGQFNYLMVDGHVELLTPEQTVGPKGKAGTLIGGHRGIWTIRADD